MEERSYRYLDRTKEVEITSLRKTTFKLDNLESQLESAVNTRTNLQAQSKTLNDQIKGIEGELTPELNELANKIALIGGVKHREDLKVKKKDLDDKILLWTEDIKWLRKVLKK